MNKVANEFEQQGSSSAGDQAETSSAQSSDLNPQTFAVIERFKRLYNELNAQTIASGIIEDSYTQDMRFEDCFHAVDGLQAFKTHCVGLYENVQSIRFDFHDEFVRPGEAMLTWTMIYAHARLNGGEPIIVEGASLIRFEDKISFHKDYFDGGQLLYEQVPVLGRVIQGLKKRVGA